MLYYNEINLSEGIDYVRVAKVRAAENAWLATIGNFKIMFVMVSIWYDDVVC